jgi:hypothetical protein
MSKKEALMRQLLESIKSDKSIESLIVNRKGIQKDVGLINHYRLHELIPNKWFDWIRRVDAKIMIIGQDWGPYASLLKFINDYEIEKIKLDFDYDKFLFKTFSSRTEKFILKSISKGYFEIFNKEIEQKDWDSFFFTIAVLFTRQGTHFRGSDNFDPKKSLDHSYPYVIKQIEIVKPKIIMPLGGMAWEILSKYYNLQVFGKTITEVINNMPSEGYIKSGEIYLIPNFHPASHVDPKIIHRQFKIIWDIMKQENFFNIS